MEKHLKTMKEAMDIEMTSMPEKIHMKFGFDPNVPSMRSDIPGYEPEPAEQPNEADEEFVEI
jgi:hypothetical protein